MKGGPVDTEEGREFQKALGIVAFIAGIIVLVISLYVNS